MGEQTGSVFRDMENPASVPSSLGVPYPDDYSEFNDFNGWDEAVFILIQVLLIKLRISLRKVELITE